MVNGIDKDMDVARLETHGDAYQEPLERLLEEIAVHERVIGGGDSERQRDLETRIDRHWRALASTQEQFGRELQFTGEGLTKRRRDHLEIAMVEGEWRSLLRSGPLSAADSALKHQHLATDLREMIKYAGDTSGLRSDPDLDTYYLMDVTLQALPQTQDRLAALASRVRILPPTGTLSDHTRTELAVTSAFLQEADQNRISSDIETSLNEDAGFHGRIESLHLNLPPATRRYVDANRSLLSLIHRSLASGDAGSLAGIAAAADHARAESFALWWVAEPELERLLEARVSSGKQAQTLGIFLMVTAVMIPGFIAFLLIRRITRPITRLSSVAKRISTDRDYSVRALPCGGGETGALIDSFNDMLSQIELHEITEESLRESEERYAMAAHGANDGLWDWKLTTNRIYCSARWNQMLGYSEGHAWSDPEEWFGSIHLADRDRVRAEIAAHREGRMTEFVSEYRMGHQKGGFIWILSRGIAVRDENGVAVRIAGSHTDITEGKIADPLTGLANRLYFVDKLENAIEVVRQKDGRFAVLFLDLDKFKVVNASLGHQAGDELLVEVAARLTASVRSAVNSGECAGTSIVARVGGDEFAILLNNLQVCGDPGMVAGRILENLAKAIPLRNRQVFAPISIGIALSSTADTPEELLRNADTAMYHAKVRGKARFEFFDEGMREQAVARLEIETNLRKAIDDGQLVLYYQPEISVTDQRVIGYEALVRWKHPERGLINPGEFIPVAEESDLIVLLGRWVLKEACRQMGEWQKSFILDPPLTISVNVSPRQLSDPGFVKELESILAQANLPPQYLKLEITESSIMVDPEVTIATLNELKRLQIGLQIDDFGTGYSSLSYLYRFPFDTLKIDRSFINEMATGGTENSQVIGTIIRLAQSLGMRVVAEGVETADQLKNLTALGCDLVQGFFFSKPISPQVTATVLQARSEREAAFGILSKSLASLPPHVLDIRADLGDLIDRGENTSRTALKIEPVVRA
jgi:diguanylate cyclase (GGDEF)-like protein/PAS domain S-box-containing protein